VENFKFLLKSNEQNLYINPNLNFDITDRVESQHNIRSFMKDIAYLMQNNEITKIVKILKRSNSTMQQMPQRKGSEQKQTKKL